MHFIFDIFTFLQSALCESILKFVKKQSWKCTLFKYAEVAFYFINITSSAIFSSKGSNTL